MAKGSVRIPTLFLISSFVFIFWYSFLFFCLFFLPFFKSHLTVSYINPLKRHFPSLLNLRPIDNQHIWNQMRNTWKIYFNKATWEEQSRTPQQCQSSQFLNQRSHITRMKDSVTQLSWIPPPLSNCRFSEIPQRKRLCTHHPKRVNEK